MIYNSWRMYISTNVQQLGIQHKNMIDFPLRQAWCDHYIKHLWSINQSYRWAAAQEKESWVNVSLFARQPQLNWCIYTTHSCVQRILQRQTYINTQKMIHLIILFLHCTPCPPEIRNLEEYFKLWPRLYPSDLSLFFTPNVNLSLSSLFSSPL